MKKLKLNLGCGSDYKKGWTNVDNYAEYKTDKQLDLDVLPYPWKTNTVDYIYMDNVLEHLEEPVKVLRECARILKPGGTLEVIVPDGLSPSACGLA